MSDITSNLAQDPLNYLRATMTEPLYKEIWQDFRPYVRAIIGDLLVVTALWLLLAGFKWVTTLIPIKGKAAEVITDIHSAGVVAVFGILAGFLIWDIITLKRSEHRERSSRND
jgi:hypothetical protein